MVLGSRSEIIWHLGLIFRFLALKQAWMVVWTLFAENSVLCWLEAPCGRQTHLTLVHHQTLLRCLRRHGNSLLLQRHPVVAWWCLWRLSVQGGETSCQRGISLESVGYLTEQWQHVTTHTGDCTLTPSKVRSLQSVGILAERQSDRL